MSSHHVNWKTGHVLLELYRLPLSSGFKEPRHFMALSTRSPEQGTGFLDSLFSTVSHPSFKLSLCRVSKSVATKLLSKCRLLRGPSCVGYCCLVSLGVVGLACVLYFYFTRNMWPLMAVPRNPQILCPPNRTMSTWDEEHYGSCTRWRYCDPSVT